MESTLSFLAGVGVGAGLMYALDPQMGQRRRAQARDTVQELWHDARKEVDGLTHDVSRRASEAVSALHGDWSPTTRLLAGVVGSGLLAFGFTQRFPTACIFGTVGAAVLGCAATNYGPADLLPERVRS